MKLTISPDSFLERAALMFNLAPTPLIETQIYFIVARAIMTAADLNIFEALGKNNKTCEEISACTHTHTTATKHLLDCLTGIGYLKWNNGHYSIKQKYYKWLLRESSSNVVDKLRFQTSEWTWMAHLPDYVRSGKAMDIHATMSPLEWQSYQEAMAAISINTARELASKIKLPATASQMLDIGGSHGLYSLELCKKYPSLSSTILELPSAIIGVQAGASRHGLTERVKYQPGNAILDNLGDELYDLVLLVNVAHHFTADENIKLTQKITRALKPGGTFGIGEFIRRSEPGQGGAISSSASLYFSMTSSSGAWSVEDINAWQREAGLKSRKKISLMNLPGWKLLLATKQY